MVCLSAIILSIILCPLQSKFCIIILNLLVCNCRAEISPRPVSQDVHLCTTFYLYRLNYVAHTLQILCFCQQLVYFWGDKISHGWQATDFRKCVLYSLAHTLKTMSEYDVQENPCNGNHSTCHPTRSFSGYLVSLNPAANGIEYELWFISGQAYCVHVHVTPARRGSLNLP